jgi:hypothetical protein
MGWLGGALGWVWDHTLGPVANGAAGFVWDQVMQGIVSWIVDSVAWFVGQVLSLLEDSTKVDLRAGWFLDPGGPYRTVLAIAAVLLLGFVFLGLLQGLVAGDPMVMLTRIARDLPLAVLGMVVTIEVATRLLQLSDALSHAVLRGGGDNAKEVLRVIGNASAFSGQSSFVIALLGLLCIIAALFVWVELVIRAALIYLLVALSPLVLAAMVWPSARGMVRKLTELLLALIFSKVVIAIAFSVGAAALAGVGNAGHANGGGASGAVTANAGTLFSGLVIFCLAAFAPFVLLKLFPAAEAAVVAQGISRGPARATQQASASAFYLERIAGTHGGNGSNGSSNGARPASRDFGSGPAGGSPSAGNAGPGSNPAGSGGGAAAGGAAAGPAAVALAGAEAARRTQSHVSRSADQATDTATRARRSTDRPGGES